MRSKAFWDVVSDHCRPAYFQGYSDCRGVCLKKHTIDVDSQEENEDYLLTSDDGNGGEEEEVYLEVDAMPRPIRAHLLEPKNEEDDAQE